MGDVTRPEPHIKHVYVWKDPDNPKSGMVMVFDQYGEQMTEYQGRYEEVAEKIKADAGPDVEYFGGVWRQYDAQCDRLPAPEEV